jgi:hypothetical protein
MHPEEVPTSQLLPGQVGYIACNMKQSSEGEILNSGALWICLMLGWQPTLVIHCIVSGRGRAHAWLSTRQSHGVFNRSAE